MSKMKNTNKTIIFFFFSLMLFSCQKVVEVVEQTYEDQSPRLVRYYDEHDGKKELLREKAYYPKRKLQMEGTFKGEKRNGLWTYYYENGNKWSEAEFVDGVYNGKSVTWFENGKKRYEGFYKDGKQTGKWKFWDEQGNFVKDIDF